MTKAWDRKPTPGPWKREDGFVFAQKTGQRIADCYCEDQPDMSNDRIEANAQLISAAPDLLQALIALHSLIERKSPIYKDPNVSEWVRMAESAIAKAEGQ